MPDKDGNETASEKAKREKREAELSEIVEEEAAKQCVYFDYLTKHENAILAARQAAFRSLVAGQVNPAMPAPLQLGFSGGEGTETDPFLISKAEDLYWLSVLLQNNTQGSNPDPNAPIPTLWSLQRQQITTTYDNYGAPVNNTSGNYRLIRADALGLFFKQTKNISLNSSCFRIGCLTLPIGSQKYPFRGNYDGNGFNISGLTYNNHDGGLRIILNNFIGNYYGLFGYVKNGSVKNLTVIGDIELNVPNDNTILQNRVCVGGVIGYGEDLSSDLANCSFLGNIELRGGFGSAGNNSVCIGGVIGYKKDVSKIIKITNCYFSGKIYTYNDKKFNNDEKVNYFVGGICGGFDIANVVISGPAINNSQCNCPQPIINEVNEISNCLTIGQFEEIFYNENTDYDNYFSYFGGIVGSIGVLNKCDGNNKCENNCLDQRTSKIEINDCRVDIVVINGGYYTGGLAGQAGSGKNYNIRFQNNNIDAVIDDINKYGGDYFNDVKMFKHFAGIAGKLATSEINDYIIGRYLLISGNRVNISGNRKNSNFRSVSGICKDMLLGSYYTGYYEYDVILADNVVNQHLSTANVLFEYCCGNLYLHDCEFVIGKTNHFVDVYTTSNKILDISNVKINSADSFVFFNHIYLPEAGKTYDTSNLTTPSPLYFNISNLELILPDNVYASGLLFCRNAYILKDCLIAADNVRIHAVNCSFTFFPFVSSVQQKMLASVF